VAHARLLLAATAVMGTQTSVDRCYCCTRGTHTVAASAHSSDGHLTSADRCYCWTHGTHTITTSTHNSDGWSDISGLLLLLDMWHMLAPTIAMGTNISGLLLLPPTVAMGHLTSDDHCYYWARGTRMVATSPTVAMSGLTLVARHHWCPQ
jgi:hypothetical protein